MGDVADETTLSCIELHFSGEILNGDGDSLEGFAAAIADSLEYQP